MPPQHGGLLAGGQNYRAIIPTTTHTLHQDIDKHIDHLGAQLQFLKQGLDATDHNAPEWLGKDLLSLRNQSGKLRDDMKRFRDQLQSEGLAVKKVRSLSLRADSRLTSAGQNSQQASEY
jgi:hypothetical protein